MTIQKKAAKLVANYLISDVQGLMQGKPFAEKNFKIFALKTSLSLFP